MARPRLLNMSGTVVPYENARVDVLSTAMKYAASLYEAMRACWSDADQQGPLTGKVRDASFRAVRDGSAPHPEWRIAVYG